MAFYKNVNTQDAIEAKGFLLEHCRNILANTYMNKFAVGSIQRAKGISYDTAKGRFEEILAKANEDFAAKTGGYGIVHANGRFMLTWQGEGEDTLGLTDENAMKLNKLEPNQIVGHAGIVTLFDMVCDQVVSEITAEIQKAHEETTEQTAVEETAEASAQ